MSKSALQLKACLRKNFTEKRRNIRITCCECFSHFLILIILVQGYNLSRILYYDAATYTTVNVNVPPTFLKDSTLDSGLQVDYGEVISTVQRVLKGPLVVPNFGLYVQASRLLSQAFSDVSGLATQTSTGRSLSNLLYFGDLHFAPKSAETYSFIDYLSTQYSAAFNEITYFVHENEDTAVGYILDNLERTTLALIVLRQITPEKVNYVVRQNYTTLPNTNDVINQFSIGLDTTYQQYLLSGFLTMEKTVNEWVFDYLALDQSPDAVCSAPPEPVLIPYPTAAYDQNPFYAQVGFLLGLALVMATLYPVSRLVKTIVEEKETKMREIMKIMGLRDWVHQLSWFLTAFVLFFWIAVSTTFITGSSFLVNSNGVLLFLFFFLFTMAEITFAFSMSVFFSNSKLAAIVAPVVLFAAILPRFIFLNTSNFEQVVPKVFTCLLAPAALAFGADIIANYEYTNTGIQLSNLTDGDFNFLTVLVMLWLDCYLYAALALYLDQVIPHEYGTAKHPLFFLSFAYWCPGSCAFGYLRLDGVEDDNLVATSELPEFQDASVDSNVELIASDLEHLAKVRIANLRKRYPDGKLAVKNLSLSMLEGHITCLLGHNGAGKTTTIAALTGLVSATAGEVSIYGKSLKNDLYAIRQMTGVCPQQNVLSPSMTVAEHLHFFANVKGFGGWEVWDRIDRMLTDIGLADKRHALSTSLSGGMKRKLSLAIALIGDPKFVLLDEPTSGMDPYSRRSTWDLLQKCKAGRVVLLTTHFMEEADTLADRIAIMSEGSLRCSGSSLYLKTRFGVGYSLTMAKSSASVDVAVITDAVHSVVPDAVTSSVVAGEVIMQLPISSVSQFPQLFTRLREVASDCGIGSYGISITTLEQVFISLAKEARQNNISEFDDNDYNARDSRLFKAKQMVQLHALYFYRYVRRQLTESSTNRVWSICQSQEKEATRDTVAATTVPGQIVDPSTSLAADCDASSAVVGDVEMPKRRDERRNGGYTTALLDFVDCDECESKSGLETAVTSSKVMNESVVEHPIIYSAIPIVAPCEVIEESKTDGLLEKQSSSMHSFDRQPPQVYLTRAPITVQFVELFRKRLIIASRDLKGFFFQVLFPAVQVILILFILTINVNPAGRTLILSGNIFSRYVDSNPTVVVAGTEDTPLRSSLSPSMALMEWDVDNTTQMSERLLLSKFYSDDRYGAFMFGDSIPFNVTVDWRWVRRNLPLLVTPSNNTIFRGIQETLGFGNFSFDDFFQDSITVNVQDILKQLDNSTLAQSLFPANFSLLDLSGIDISTSFGSFTYNATTGSISFNNISVEVPGLQIDISLDAIDIPALNLTDLVISLLPNETEHHVFNIPVLNSLMHNTSASSHGIAAYRGELTASSFRTCSSSGASSQYLIKNHPLPLTVERTIEIKVILSVLTSLFILVPLCYIPAAFVSFIVKERVSKSKHLQIVSSVSPYLYWFSTYCWDMVLFTILASFILAGFFMFGQDTAGVFINSAQSSGALFLLLMTYGASAIPLSYLYSMLFTNFSTAQISIMAINFVTGFVMVLAYYVMISIPDTEAVGEQLVHFFRFFPAYNIGEGLINMSAIYYLNEVGNENISYFDSEVTGRNLQFMTFEAFGYFLIVLLTESRSLLRLLHAIDRFRSLRMGSPPPALYGTDVDVEAEQEVVADADPADYALLIRKLVKTYPPSILGGKAKHAVREISFGCKDGERFGALGINGAGKTTTLSVLTGDLQATSGEVFIGGRPLSDPTTMQLLGYCPQTDPILELMNGYETLYFFGRIRGMSVIELKKKVESLIWEVGLQPFASKPCGTYSGGNKRKLSLAVALIGDPKVLLLDEPSTGMDPEARRQMWSVIEKVSKNRSIVLVSHSMEEVEALCTRVGVMVSGRMRCIGSIQNLKGRFGGDYQVEVRCHADSAEECMQLCQDIMPLAELDERQGGYFRLRVDRSVDLAGGFATLESNKERLRIYDYSISQCTLEHIFLQFAKDQDAE